MTFQEYIENRLASRALMNYEDLVLGLDNARVKKLAFSRYKRDSLLLNSKTKEEYIAEVLTRISQKDAFTCTSSVHFSRTKQSSHSLILSVKIWMILIWSSQG